MWQTAVSQDCKDNPKRFWNYVNSKIKNKDKIGDLLVVKNDSVEVASTDATKAEALSSFF